MGTLSSLLNLSVSALQANQTAIDITSNNVANANTPGYTEQAAVWQEIDRVSLSGTTSVGSGATVTDVSQRDRVLEQRIQQVAQLQFSASTQNDALTQLQSVFGITATSTSASSTTIGTDMDTFFSSLSTLQASPSDTTARQAVLNAAQTLAADCNSASNQIASQTASLNQQVGGVVDQVNTLTASIAKLNLQISGTSPNADAGTLEDERQQDLTQLSQLIGFNQTTTESNGLTLTTANGALLVGEGQAYPLGTALVGGEAAVVTTGQGSGDITAGLTGGQLGGLLQARDGDLPTTLTALNSLVDGIADAVNTQNAAGLDAHGNPGGAIFSYSDNPPGAAATLAVVTNDPNAIAAAAAVGEGSSGGTNATALAGIQSTSLARLNGQTAPAYYALFLTELGERVSSAAGNSTVQQASLTQLTTQRNALSGVSLDQEAANLTKYQNSYEAAAKVFSIVDTLFAAALNLGVQTSVA